MHFVPREDYENDGERVFWEAVKDALKEEKGYCWRKYPVTNINGHRFEPDILVLHPDWGLNVIEVKGCSISNIETIEGYIWYMRNWYSDDIAPLEQAEKQMWAIADRLKNFRSGLLRASNGYCKVNHRAFVALPFINEQEWQEKLGENLSAPTWQAIFSTDLSPERLLHKLVVTPKREQGLTEEEWDAAVALLTGSEAIQQRPRRPTKRHDSKAAWLRQSEQKIKAFDLQQHRVAIQIPAGPQRIRGLAGTGKTIVLAQKTANMHVTYPNWDIVVTFYSRSLYEQITNYIRGFVQQFSQGTIDEPNWEKIHILHGWGGHGRRGFYYDMCEAMRQPFRSWDSAVDHFATLSARIALDKCCEELIASGSVPELFDAILIDEAQDFGEHFFRLCYHALRQPKRIIWGYDEVQSLEELKIPTAEMLFGKDVDDNPLVNLDGVYPNEAEKDMILYHCYRNPRPVLIAAHSFGLGLRRKGGALQFIDTVAGWQDIGYDVRGAKGKDLKKGMEVTLYRPESNSPHLLEKLAGYHNLVSWKLFRNRDRELKWIVEDITRNIVDEELRPDEIAVIALDSRRRYADREYSLLYEGLLQNGITAIRVGTDTGNDVFRVNGAVTITSIFRAKGNEASLVYVYGFEYAGIGRGDHDVVIRRNQAFTAMSRTRGWLVLTGIGNVAKESFEEIEAILEQIGAISFVVPDMEKIQRNLETYEYQRRRKRVKKAEQSIQKTIKDLADVDPDEISSDMKKQLLRLLLGDKDFSDLE